MRAHLLAAAAAIGFAQPALAQSAATTTPSSNFGLGEIIVTAPRAEGVAVGSATLSSDAIYAFNRTTLDDAVNLLPGV
jgi:iron complex outermembrane receptor protein